MNNLEQYISEITEGKIEFNQTEFDDFKEHFINSLNTGSIRSAENDSAGNWNPNIWVKKGIILLFKYGKLTDMSISDDFRFFDKDTLPLHPFNIDSGVRIVPGGSSIRTGCYVAKSVICMPPMYVNIGSYVDEETLIDSHALVGTCAQLGKRIHLSAAAQVGGVLEPMGARPVVIEDDVMVGGNCGIYEGTLVRNRAVLASGVILTASTKVFDLVNETIITSSANSPLEIPSGAVVVAGSRKIKTPFGESHGLSIASPLIIKYRDDRTDARTALESALR